MAFIQFWSIRQDLNCDRKMKSEVNRIAVLFLSQPKEDRVTSIALKSLNNEILNSGNKVDMQVYVLSNGGLSKKAFNWCKSHKNFHYFESPQRAKG